MWFLHAETPAMVITNIDLVTKIKAQLHSMNVGENKLCPPAEFVCQADQVYTYYI
jgi:hypothetical protein